MNNTISEFRARHFFKKGCAIIIRCKGDFGIVWNNKDYTWKQVKKLYTNATDITYRVHAQPANTGKDGNK